MTKHKKIVCFFGIGNVGFNFFKILKKIYKNRYIFLIFSKNNNYLRKRLLEKKKTFIFFLKKYKSYLLNKKVKLVVEVTGNNNLTKKIFDICLGNKKIITANKKYLCLNYKFLCKFINKNLFIEPSILGGIPIVNSLSTHFINFNLKKVNGILNGTTNFILYKMLKKNITYNEALNIANIKGFSEKKPILDISGSDSFYKIYIISKLLGFDYILNKKNISGIGNIKLFHINILKNINYFPFLNGTIFLKKNFISLEVYPYINNKYLKNQYNYLKISTNKEDFLFYGKGAGGKVTSFSLLKDFLNNKRIYKKLISKKYHLDIIRRKILIIFKKIKYIKINKFFLNIKIICNISNNKILIRNFLSNKRIKNIKFLLNRYISGFFFLKI
ncbi:hypothetical protein ACWNYI_00530 [Candidatus Vidania fulgoroideorum]